MGDRFTSDGLTSANPFVHRGPIRDPAFFFNRRREIGRAIELIVKAQSVSFVGPRRIGKTSLLFHLANCDVLRAHGLPVERLCLVFVDCASWGKVVPNELYGLLLKVIRHTLASSNQELDLPVPGETISFAILDDAIRAIADRSIQLVLLLDEFEILSSNPNLDSDVFSSLRALTTAHSVAYITVSTRPLLHLTFANANTLSSPFFNFLAQIRVPLFTPAEGVGLLKQLSSHTDIPFEQPLVDLLLELAGPHPLLLQIAGYHAVDCQQAFGRPLEVADYEFIRRAFETEASDHWAYFWHTLDPSDQRLLAVLPALWRDNRDGVMRLEHAGLVVRDEANAVAPLSPAFQAFVGRQLVPQLIQQPPITIDLEYHLVLRRGKPITLPPNEFNLLVLLMKQPNRIVLNQELQSALWPDADRDLSNERLRVTVRSLRQLLAEDGECIRNIRGQGYQFVGN